MKTVLAALVAGILGGGAAIGAVATGLIPVENLTGQPAAPVVISESDDDGLEDRLLELERHNADLKSRLDEFGDKQNIIETKVWDIEDNAATKAELSAKADKSYVDEKTAGRVMAKAAGDGSAVEAQPATPEFRAAFRAELDVLRAEEAEQKRLTKQAKRLENLEKQKARIVEYVPKLIARQAEKLGLDEATELAVSDTLVQHAQFRAELFSEAAEKKIDGEEVDGESFKQSLEELNETTLSALSASVDDETAQKLMKSVNRGNKRGGDRGNNRRR